MPHDLVPTEPTSAGSPPPAAGGVYRPGSETLLNALRDLTGFTAQKKVSPNSETGRVHHLCEQIRRAGAVDLVAVLEPFTGAELGHAQKLVRFLAASGEQAETVTGVFSRIGAESPSGTPEALIALGYSDARLFAIDPDDENSCLLGAFWKGRVSSSPEFDAFLESAAHIVQSEMRRDSTDRTQDLLAERLYHEQRAHADVAAALEDRLRAESLYRTVDNTIPFGVWVADADGRPNYASTSFLELIGMSLEDYRAFKWKDLVHPEDQGALDEWLECVRTRGSWSREFRIRGADDHMYTVLSRGAPYRDQDGHVVGWAGVTFDITGHRRTEDQLKQNELQYNELQYKEIVNLANEGIWKVDALGATIFVNSRFTEITGYSEDETQGRAIWDFVGGCCRESFGQCWYGLQKGLRQQFDCSFRRKDGSPIWVMVSSSPILNTESKFAGALILMTDVSARKAAEEELKRAKISADEANRAKSQFLANMSHEIRTPLGAILGFAELLLDDTQPENQRLDCVNAICRNGRQLLSLINDILDLSKVEAGRLDVEPTPFSLDDFLMEVQSNFQPQAAAKGLKFEIETAKDLPHTLCSDITRLRQILFNLIGNALKFTHEGFVKLRLRRSEGHIIGEVCDSGYGISRDQRDRLFAPFAQADPTIARRFGGTGLGLVLSRRLARALGGDVYLSFSAPGRGSIFEFRVRIDLREPSPNGRDLKPVCESAPRAIHWKGDRLDHVHVLIVDDAIDNRVLVKRMLERAGAHVATAEDGVEAVKKALTGHFDIILMDIQMPVMDGCEATKQLRSKGYRGPIIALTAHAMKEERDLFLEAGCNRTLTKPIDRRALFEAIHTEMRESLELRT